MDKASNLKLTKIQREKLLSYYKASKDWVPDDDAPSCFKCLRQFVFLVRHRHHCRGCGKVFC